VNFSEQNSNPDLNGLVPWRKNFIVPLESVAIHTDLNIVMTIAV